MLGMFIVTSAFVGCKKGEDDPFISLKSRKARVAGDWKMTDFKSTDTDASGVTTITSNGSTYTYTSPLGTLTGSLTQEATFEKDGTYKYSEVYDGVSASSEGFWNFTCGVGELKKKSQITLYDTKYTDPGGTSTWTGNYVDGAYDLKELRNKKMVWYYKVTEVDNSGQTSTYESTTTWEPK